MGALLFTALGLLYLVAMGGRSPWATYLLIAGPLFLIAILFLIDWLYRGPMRSKATQR